MSKPLLVVVDDEPDIAAFVGDVGEFIGFDVVTTYSSRQFQQACLSTPPSAIVMDIVMPDIDGIELIGWLSEQKISAPIIIMSGYDGYIGMTELLGEKQGLTIVGTLTKPFRIDDIEPLLLKIIDPKK